MIRELLRPSASVSGAEEHATSDDTVRTMDGTRRRPYRCAQVRSPFRSPFERTFMQWGACREVVGEASAKDERGRTNRGLSRAKCVAESTRPARSSAHG